MSKLVLSGSVGALVASAALAVPAPAAPPPLPTLHLSAPTTVKVNQPYRVRAYGETKPGAHQALYVFIRSGGKCKKTPTAEAMDGSYSAFGATVTRVGPGKYSKKTPKTVFEKVHRHAKICGFLTSQQVDRRVVRNIESVAD